jgi:hypothetical protein
MFVPLKNNRNFTDFKMNGYTELFTPSAFDKLVLRKRSIIETINDQLKNIFNLEHLRHRSLINFAVNVVACLVAYSYKEKKPALNLCRQDLLAVIT